MDFTVNFYANKQCVKQLMECIALNQYHTNMFSHAYDMFIMMFKLNKKEALEVEGMSQKYNNNVKPPNNFAYLKRHLLLITCKRKLDLFYLSSLHYRILEFN